jgi:CheY-like chemotaxis protein
MTLPAQPKPTILIAEDNADTAQTYQRLLRHVGYETELAANGTMAMLIFARLARTPVDLILMDIIMPGLSGDGLVKYVRRLPGWNGVPIVVCSGEPEAMVRGILGSRIDGFLAKPVAAETLLQVVRQFAPLPE